MKHDVNEIMHS